MDYLVQLDSCTLSNCPSGAAGAQRCGRRCDVGQRRRGRTVSSGGGDSLLEAIR